MRYFVLGLVLFCQPGRPITTPCFPVRRRSTTAWAGWNSAACPFDSHLHRTRRTASRPVESVLLCGPRRREDPRDRGGGEEVDRPEPKWVPAGAAGYEIRAAPPPANPICSEITPGGGQIRACSSAGLFDPGDHAPTRRKQRPPRQPPRGGDRGLALGGLPRLHDGHQPRATARPRRRSSARSTSSRASRPTSITSTPSSASS